MSDIILENFEKRHLAQTFLWMQDEGLKKDFMFAAKVTEQRHEEWYNYYCKDSTQKIWAVCNERRHVGNIGLKNIDIFNKKAEGWIYIGERDLQGKYVGSNSWLALFQNMEYTALGLHKVYSHVAEWNIASMKMFLRVGFEEEGVLKDEVYFQGGFVTLHRFGFIFS